MRASRLFLRPRYCFCSSHSQAGRFDPNCLWSSLISSRVCTVLPKDTCEAEIVCVEFKRIETDFALIEFISDTFQDFFCCCWWWFFSTATADFQSYSLRCFILRPGVIQTFVLLIFLPKRYLSVK